MRALHPRHGIHAPSSVTPRRQLRSLRRTATTDMVRPDGLQGELVLEGRARDLWTDSQGAAHVLAEASYCARVAYRQGREVMSLQTCPEQPAAQRLVGMRATSGFRAALDTVLADQRETRTLLYLLLDDLPVSTLVSGHALSWAGAHSPISSPQIREQQADVCSGWRRGGTLLVELEQTGIPPVTTGPESPALCDELDFWAWHALPPLPLHGLRRHRRLDLLPGELLGVDAFLRDVHCAADGVQRIVHEYTIGAHVEPVLLAFREIEARAHVLPWIECGSAVASAGRLAGRSVDGLRRAVRNEITGTTTCTHLNDTLRSLEDIGALAGTLAELAGPSSD